MILPLYQFIRSSKNSSKSYKRLEKYVHLRFTRALLSRISHIHWVEPYSTTYNSIFECWLFWKVVESCAKKSPACFLNSIIFAEFKLNFICSNLCFAANAISTLSGFFLIFLSKGFFCINIPLVTAKFLRKRTFTFRPSEATCKIFDWSGSLIPARNVCKTFSAVDLPKNSDLR